MGSLILSHANSIVSVLVNSAAGTRFSEYYLLSSGSMYIGVRLFQYRD